MYSIYNFNLAKVFYSKMDYPIWLTLQKKKKIAFTL